jgi:phosphoribosylanthranilate isomerase
MAEIKFCGMMRREDADAAAALGARYIGVVFAESPRQVSDERAREVFAGVPLGISRVGVFGDTKPEQIAARADALGLDVVQLHGDPKPRMIARVRKRWHGRVWAVQRITDTLPDSARELFEVSDGVVLDARTPDQLGGTGVALPWEDLQERVDLFRPPRAKLVLAGGLTPENVARAIGVLRPDVVDVSSGVELMVGIKDHARMQAFRDAVLGARVG